MYKSIVTLVLFLGALVLGIFFLFPLWKEYRFSREDTKALTDISGRLDEIEKTRDKLLDQVNSISKNDLEKIEKVIPSGPSEEDFLRFLEHITAQNSISLSTVQLSAIGSSSGAPRPGGVSEIVPGEQGISGLSFNISTAGNYGNFKKLLDDFERNIRIIDISTISFTGLDQEEKRVNISIVGRTYYQ